MTFVRYQPFLVTSLLVTLFACLSISGSLAMAVETAGAVTAGPFKFRFASLQQGQAVLGKSDPFSRSMSPFDRQVRMGTAEDQGEAAYLRFAATHVRAWPDSDREAVTAAVEAIAASLKRIADPAVKEVLLIYTTGDEEGRAAGYTRGNAIVLTKGRTGTKVSPPSKLVAHELFHVLSRHDEAMSDKLYERIGFRRIGPISLPGELADRKITNPDAPIIAHVIDVQLDEQRTVMVAPVLFAKREYDPQSKQSLFAYLQFQLMEMMPLLTKLHTARLADGKPVLHPPSLPDYRRQIGRNARQIIHPEEIWAENFAHWVVGEKDVPDPWLIKVMDEAMTSRP